MTSDLLFSVLQFNLAIAAASILMMALRGTLLSHFGARIAYHAWLVVPLAGLATLAPPREIVTTEVTGASLTTHISAPTLESSGLIDQAWLAPTSTILTILWLVGALAAFAALLWRHRRFVEAMGGLSAEVVCGASVLRASTSDHAPLTLGAIRPKIVVPADFEERFTPREQVLIIAHEQWHIRSGDVVVNAALELSACLFWFNPILRGAIRFMREDQELACDAAIVASRQAVRRTYAEALLNAQTVVDAIPIGCGWPSTERALVRRIAALRNKPPGRGVQALGLLVVFGLSCGLSLAAWASDVRRTAPVQQVAQYADRAEMRGAVSLGRVNHALETARADPQRGVQASRSTPLVRTNDARHHQLVVREELDQQRATDFNNADNRSNDARRDMAGNFELRGDDAGR